MKIEKIFDGLTHPSIQVLREWRRGRPSGYSNNVSAALAVSLPPIKKEGEDERYIEAALETNHFSPVMAIDPREPKIEAQINKYTRLGSVGIKVHPRFLSWNWTDAEEFHHLDELGALLTALNTPLFFCTYYAARADLYPKQDPIYILSNLLSKHPNLKMVLLHGGGNRLMDYIEFARFNNNILLDLSFSPIKYAGSSYDYDLSYALSKFNKRISFGSDWPYCNQDDAIAAILSARALNETNDEMSADEGVWGGNLKSFLDL